MRRQRFMYTLPPQDNSSVFLDSENIRDLSGHYYSLENIWPQMISTVPDTSIPYNAYQYPYFFPAEQMKCSPECFNTTLNSGTFSAAGDLNQYNDDVSNICNSITADAFFNCPYEERIIPEDIIACTETPVMGNFGDIQYKDHNTFPKVTIYGTVTILLKHLIRVDISPARSLQVTNPSAASIAAVNAKGDESFVIHPNGKVHLIGRDIYMDTLDRQAKICERGIIFTSTKRCLKYLVDESGTKTVSEKLRNLNENICLEVFYNNGMTAKKFEECFKLVNEAVYKSYKNGDKVWMIGGFRIKQDQKGNVRITRNGDRYDIQTSPTTGLVTVKLSSAEINIGGYPDGYFAVSKGNKHVTATLKRFNVQNGAHKAGLNNSSKVVLF